MSTYWDDFIDEHDGKWLPHDRRELLKMFYLWLVTKDLIKD